MLPKSERLDTRRFNEIIASGRNINAGGFYFKVLDNENRRFAVVVPKKVLKSAIKRHLVKRRVFNALRQTKDLFPAADYLIFVNKENIELSVAEIVDNLKNSSQKLASVKIQQYN